MPQPPYPGFLERLLAEVGRRAGAAPPVSSPHAGAEQRAAAAVEGAVEGLAADLVDLSHDLHDHPELGYAEHHAVAAVAALLQRHGHRHRGRRLRAADRPACAHGAGPARASRSWPSTTRCPGIGPRLRAQRHLRHRGRRVPRAGDRSPGTWAVSVELHRHPGRGGRRRQGADRARRRLRRDRRRGDAAPLRAPTSAEPPLPRRAHGRRDLRRGWRRTPRRSRSWAATPWTPPCRPTQAMAQLRQHMLPTDRVHGIITDGGQKPNIVPERAAADVLPALARARDPGRAGAARRGDLHARAAAADRHRRRAGLGPDARLPARAQQRPLAAAGRSTSPRAAAACSAGGRPPRRR